MVALDKVYCRHYRRDCSLQKCFDITGSSKQSVEAKKRYTDYLADAHTKLKTFSLSSQLKVSLEAFDLFAFSTKHAAAKLDPLFEPVGGQICLPLLTTSMFKNLKTCLEVDSHIIAEILLLYT